MTTSYDAIIIGLGGMGSAAALEFARRGARVLGLEQFYIGHDRGSSHGHTRIIRQAYYEHPAYVPLVRRAYQGWYDLEQRQGVHLVTSCPCLTIGPPDGELVSGVRRSAAEHGLPIDNLSPAELAQRYPAFRFGEESPASRLAKM
jgi:sarcosine oxidase